MSYRTDFTLGIAGYLYPPYREHLEKTGEPIPPSIEVPEGLWDESIWEGSGLTIRTLYDDDLYDASWYDYEEEFTLLSLKYPEITFVLSGKGEDTEDWWTMWFKNGKSIKKYVEIRWPELAEGDFD